MKYTISSKLAEVYSNYTEIDLLQMPKNTWLGKKQILKKKAAQNPHMVWGKGNRVRRCPFIKGKKKGAALLLVFVPISAYFFSMDLPKIVAPLI